MSFTSLSFVFKNNCDSETVQDGKSQEPIKTGSGKKVSTSETGFESSQQEKYEKRPKALDRGQRKKSNELEPDVDNPDNDEDVTKKPVENPNAGLEATTFPGELEPDVDNPDNDEDYTTNWPVENPNAGIEATTFDSEEKNSDTLEKDIKSSGATAESYELETVNDEVETLKNSSKYPTTEDITTYDDEMEGNKSNIGSEQEGKITQDVINSKEATDKITSNEAPDISETIEQGRSAPTYSSTDWETIEASSSDELEPDVDSPDNEPKRKKPERNSAASFVSSNVPRQSVDEQDESEEDSGLVKPEKDTNIFSTNEEHTDVYKTDAETSNDLPITHTSMTLYFIGISIT